MRYLAWLLVMMAAACSETVAGLDPAAAKDGGAESDAAVRDGGPDASVIPPPADAGVMVDPPMLGASLAAGNTHTCARISQGTVECWGDNRNGALGDGTTMPRSTPVTVLGLRGVLELSAGVGHTCARLDDGTVQCWGRNDFGALGDGTMISRTSPVEVTGLDAVVQISAGNWHTCALLSSGTVRCWGRNLKGALGDGTTTFRLTPVPMVQLSEVAEVAAGEDVTCARRADGTVHCAGFIFPDGLGAGTLTAIQIDDLEDIVQIDAGYGHFCALARDGRAHCMGPNTNGELGDGTRQHRSTPVEVVLGDVAQISLGGHTCVRQRSGAVTCWGLKISGRVLGLDDAVEIVSGGGHSCARKADGTIRCWGYNYYAQTMAGGCCHDGLCGLPEGTACGAQGGVCNEGWCSGCGGADQPCCDIDNAPERCRSDTPLCTSQEICVACGGLGEPCCAGNACGDDAVCFNDSCVMPGEPGAPCLPNNACSAGCCVQQEHSAKVCVNPGAICPAPAGPLAGMCAADGSCGACGGLSQPCCPTQESSRVPFYCSAEATQCADEVCVSN